MRKIGCHIKESFHGGPSKILSPPADHPITYEKFVMDKNTKAKNMQKIFFDGPKPGGPLTTRQPEEYS